MGLDCIVMTTSMLLRHKLPIDIINIIIDFAFFDMYEMPKRAIENIVDDYPIIDMYCCGKDCYSVSYMTALNDEEEVKWESLKFEKNQTFTSCCQQIFCKKCLGSHTCS